VPLGCEVSVGITCRGGDTQLHALIALYLPDGKLRNKGFKAGIFVNDRTFALSQAFLVRHAKLTLHPALDPVARIATLDLPISPRFVRGYGHMTLFATLSDSAQGTVEAADSIHLLAFGQTIVLELANPMVLGTLAVAGPGQQTGTTGAGSIGSIYVPLPLGDGVHDWAPGQVCYQQTALIGVSGPKITQEVVSAECQVGWDGYCPANCPATVGNTYDTIDPFALIGG
jgi:hypothetical protein